MNDLNPDMSSDASVPPTPSPSPCQSTPQEQTEAPPHEDQEQEYGQESGPQTFASLHDRVVSKKDIVGGAVAAIHAKSNGSIFAPNGITCRIYLVDFLHGNEVLHALFLKPDPDARPNDGPLFTEDGFYFGESDSAFDMFRDCGIHIYVSGDLRPAHHRGSVVTPGNPNLLMRYDFARAHSKPTYGVLFNPMPRLDLTVATRLEDPGIIGRVISLIHMPSGEVLGDGVIGWNRRL